MSKEKIRKRRKYVKFTFKETMKFLQLYRHEQLLYDTSLPQHRDRYLRKVAAARIADAMGIPGFGIPEVIQKFRMLRVTYSNDLKKMENRMPYPDSTCDASFYVPKAYWFTAMNSFLRPFIKYRERKKKRRTQTRAESAGSQLVSRASNERQRRVVSENHRQETVVQPDENLNYRIGHAAKLETIIDLDDSSDSHDTTFANKHNVHNETPHHGNSTAESSLTASCRQPQQQSGVMVDRASEVNVPTLNIETDSFGIFGRIVVSHLRQLPLQTALEAQRFITEYLIKTRLEHMSNGRVMLAEVTPRNPLNPTNLPNPTQLPPIPTQPAEVPPPLSSVPQTAEVAPPLPSVPQPAEVPPPLLSVAQLAEVVPPLPSVAQPAEVVSTLPSGTQMSDVRLSSPQILELSCDSSDSDLYICGNYM